MQEGLEDQQTVIKTLQAKLKVSANPSRLVLDWSVIVVDRVDVIDVS